MEKLREALSHLATEDLVTVAVELAGVLVLFLLVGWILRHFLVRLSRVPAMARFESGVLTIRRNLRSLLALLFFLSCAALLAANGYLLYRGERLAPYTVELVRGIPPSFWRDLAISLMQVAGLAIAVAFGLRLVRRALDWLCARAKAWEGIRTNDESVDVFFSSLAKLISRGAWFSVLAYSTRLLGLPEAIPSFLFLAVRVYLTIGGGLILWRALDAIVESLDALSRKYSSEDNLLRFYSNLEHLVPVFRRTLEYAIYISVASLVALQIEPLAPLAGWWPRLIRILGIIFLSRVAVEITKFGSEEVLIRRPKLDEEQRQRRLTIIPLIQSALKYLVYFGAAVVILKEIGINPTPVLAGAGIVGLAVGLGAQNLFNDLVSGFFILFEDYFLVGDYVEVDDAEGFVERIDLRTTHIRDEDGRLHIVRNGNIDRILHYSKPYSVAVVHVGVAYESDLERVFEVLDEVGRDLLESDDDVTELPEARGIEEFGESALVLEIETRVKPGKHLDVARRQRLAIKRAFDRSGIEIPYPKRVIYQGGDKAPPA